MAPPKIPKKSLNEIKPSKEELADARRIINESAEPQKKERSLMQSMATYLKQAGPENPGVVDSRGGARKAYLEKYMVLQAREKKARQDQTTQRTSGSATKTRSEIGWWPYETMILRLGKARFFALLEAKKIDSKEDARLKDEQRGEMVAVKVVVKGVVVLVVVVVVAVVVVVLVVVVGGG